MWNCHATQFDNNNLNQKLSSTEIKNHLECYLKSLLNISTTIKTYNHGSID